MCRNTKAIELLIKLENTLKILHLDMSGKHTYMLSSKSNEVITEIKNYLWEEGNKEKEESEQMDKLLPKNPEIGEEFHFKDYKPVYKIKGNGNPIEGVKEDLIVDCKIVDDPYVYLVYTGTEIGWRFTEIKKEEIDLTEYNKQFRIKSEPFEYE